MHIPANRKREKGRYLFKCVRDFQIQLFSIIPCACVCVCEGVSIFNACLTLDSSMRYALCGTHMLQFGI